MTSVIFRYAIRHIFIANFWLSAMNRHPPLTTLGEIEANFEKLTLTMPVQNRKVILRAEPEIEGNFQFYYSFSSISDT